jgi:esterase/lipase superfamily enzyme
MEVDERKIDVHYATDRQLEGTENGVDKFGVAQNQTINYGIAKVSIPPHHVIGELETPRLYMLEFHDDTTKHIVITKTRKQNRQSFFQSINNAAGSSTGHALLFVHGYNTDFKEATKRTAQLVYDLQFKGQALMFSWPSHGSISHYTVDEANILWATSDIKKFIVDALDMGHIGNLYIVAHSMGNRGVTSAIIQLAQERPELTSRIKEIILAAPDIGADYFKRDIAAKLISTRSRITLYASSKDKPLRLSRGIHSEVRLGESSPSIVVIPGIESIDASKVDLDIIGHSYFSQARPVLTDLFGLVHDGKGAASRYGLSNSPNLPYWHFLE